MALADPRADASRRVPPLPVGQARLAMLLVDLPHLASVAEREGVLEWVVDPHLAPLARAVIDVMRAVAIPNGIAGVGYAAADVAALVDGAAPQQRLLANAPCTVGRPELASLFAGALEYW